MTSPSWRFAAVLLIRGGRGGSRLWCRSHIQKREYGASHIFESAAKGHNEEVSMTTTFVVTSCQSWELAPREELHGALMVGVFGHEHAEERAAVDEDVVYRRVSWLSA